ncbi:hypothetical protein TREMEDRAFT_61941 [Tremella mesenterica DSM 1558]|uniref:uncharacterized protein n=1 Tax=Tremella mesenterica (strain ATCC 24925 / CBS 8224 / DSM 1558 / NBRC 9311 / NRRL Y-6157 / RJB 2259-6 / UBC 559-6) TaxID=578456 RepID=UPI0003F497B7|nr:uncharacterized protein TREMEDRAFT_61941 [Tremella mesenterica DSM 1558]EIW70177.1 hypothetical protein TREMEDRAFT_61941 [Tremella mesenterica DSM 1558]
MIVNELWLTLPCQSQWFGVVMDSGLVMVKGGSLMVVVRDVTTWFVTRRWGVEVSLGQGTRRGTTANYGVVIGRVSVSVVRVEVGDDERKVGDGKRRVGDGGCQGCYEVVCDIFTQSGCMAYPAHDPAPLIPWVLSEVAFTVDRKSQVEIVRVQPELLTF